MTVRKGYILWIVALNAEFASGFFIHTKKSLVICIVGNFGGSFFRGIKEKGYKCYGCYDKSDINEKGFFLFRGSHGGLGQVKGLLDCHF